VVAFCFALPFFPKGWTEWNGVGWPLQWAGSDFVRGFQEMVVVQYDPPMIPFGKLT
jgi:hypothetical protein